MKPIEQARAQDKQIVKNGTPVKQFQPANELPKKKEWSPPHQHELEYEETIIIISFKLPIQLERNE